MKILIALILFSIFLLLSGIHFFWGLGGKWGLDVAVPSAANGKKVLNPKISDCFIVGFGLLCFGIFILTASGLLNVFLPPRLLNFGLWIISIIFIFRAIGEFKYVGFFKKIRTTEFGKLDTIYFSPLCLLIGLLVIVLSLFK